MFRHSIAGFSIKKQTMSNIKINTGLQGKRALVTGGTKGIGKAIADELAQAGAQVIVSARSHATEVIPGQHFIAADLTQPEQVVNLKEKIDEQFGGIDILINNAGGLTHPGGGFGTLTDEHWEHEIQLNLLAAVRLDRLLLPKMIEQKSGVIIPLFSFS